jgi:uncharacterized membrane protein YsdA (DUF1294 family)
MKMVWHIFKKDVRLLRLFVLGYSGVQFLSTIGLYVHDHLPSMGAAIYTMLELLQFAALLAMGLLIVMVVQQDAIPGVQQDWLIRPIRRRDLLLAKFLFVLLMIHGPILLGDTLQGLANGFPLSQSLGAAASRNLYLLIGLSIPMLAFASLTRNMSEALIGGLLALLGFSVLVIIFNTPHQRGELRGTGLYWMAESTMFLIALVGSGSVLALQYFHRKTVSARWTMAAVSLLFLFAYLLPMNLAFAVERRLSPNPGAGDNIMPVFAPALGRFQLPQGVSHKSPPVSMGASLRDEASTVYLPLRISKLPENAVLNADGAEAVLTGMDGKLIYRGPADSLLVRKDTTDSVYFHIGYRLSGFFREVAPEDKPFRNEPLNHDGAFVYQGLAIPSNLYGHIKDEPLRLEINYSLTLLRGSTSTLPAINGDVRISHVGRCKTRMDSDGDDIQLHCIQAGATPHCASIRLENSQSGKKNPSFFSCWPDYSPYFGTYYPDAMARFGASLRFRDLSGLAKYPVDSSQISQAQVVASVYEAQDHFNRRLVIPQIRLSDWESIEP